jgi:mono/diheme cytochrome c family protein
MMSGKILMGVMTGLLLFAWQSAPVIAAAARNSCVSCHTNDKMMKMLYKPPALEGGDAEV